MRLWLFRAECNPVDSVSLQIEGRCACSSILGEGVPVADVEVTEQSCGLGCFR
jgi:hypothetical protein